MFDKLQANSCFNCGGPVYGSRYGFGGSLCKACENETKQEQAEITEETAETED